MGYLLSARLNNFVGFFDVDVAAADNGATKFLVVLLRFTFSVLVLAPLPMVRKSTERGLDRRSMLQSVPQRPEEIGGGEEKKKERKKTFL